VKQDYLGLFHQVLDHEVVDANNIPCGMVDDLQLEGGPGGELRVTGLLIGPGVWSDRLPRLFCKLARLICGDDVKFVPWSEVLVITERVKLRSRAEDLGLDLAEKKASRLISRIPGA
jgi:hypothetical protein